MVIVFGSINLDLVCRVASFPSPGETISGSSFATFPGGKGANQALAAARAGAPVRLFGAVGTDAFTDAAMSLLMPGGVNVDGVARVDEPTGCATILVDDKGENCIVVVAGANAKADPLAVPDAALTSGTVLVLQQEVDAAANVALIARARRAGARIVLNAAPAHPVSFDLLRSLDILIVNEAEAHALASALGWTGTPHDFATRARAASPGLVIVVTLGAGGALWFGPDAALRAAAPKIDVVDTTGAGDVFHGALAFALGARAALAEAFEFATVAAALKCRQAGGRAGIPDLASALAGLQRFKERA